MRGSARRSVGPAASLDRYTKQLHQLGLESSEREVRWLNELIASRAIDKATSQERRRTRPWVRTAPRCAWPLWAWGTVPRPWFRACSTTRMPTRRRRVPGLMHVKFGKYHVRDVQFVAAFDVDAKKVGFDLSEAIFASENNTIKIADVPPADVPVSARPHPRRHRQVLRRDHRDLRRRARRRRQGSQGRQGRRARLLPARGFRGRRQVLRTVRASTRMSHSSTPCPCSSLPTRSGLRSSRTPASRSSATTSSSQVGATITHRVMAKLFEDRGVQLDRTIS